MVIRGHAIGLVPVQHGPRNHFRSPHSALGAVGIAAISVLNDQLTRETSAEQRHQIVDISKWRVHNGDNS